MWKRTHTDPLWVLWVVSATAKCGVFVPKVFRTLGAAKQHVRELEGVTIVWDDQIAPELNDIVSAQAPSKKFSGTRWVAAPTSLFETAVIPEQRLHADD